MQLLQGQVRAALQAHLFTNIIARVAHAAPPLKLCSRELRIAEAAVLVYDFKALLAQGIPRKARRACVRGGGDDYYSNSRNVNNSLNVNSQNRQVFWTL